MQSKFLREVRPTEICIRSAPITLDTWTGDTWTGSLIANRVG
jgi:hypothetical protein